MAGGTDAGLLRAAKRPDLAEALGVGRRSRRRGAGQRGGQRMNSGAGGRIARGAVLHLGELGPQRRDLLREGVNVRRTRRELALQARHTRILGWTAVEVREVDGT